MIDRMDMIDIVDRMDIGDKMDIDDKMGMYMLMTYMEMNMNTNMKDMNMLGMNMKDAFELQ
jgi:hypothetical protein